MLTLIIQVIAIALGLAMAISGIFYGGEALSRGTAKATAATFVNQGQQFLAANTMKKNDTGGVTTVALDDLVTDKYLLSLPKSPKGGEWTLAAAQTYNNYSYDGSAAKSTLNGATTLIANSVEAIATAAKPIPDGVCNEINKNADKTNVYGCVQGLTPDLNKVWHSI